MSYAPLLDFSRTYQQNVLGMRVGVFFCFEYIEDEVCEKFRAAQKAPTLQGASLKKE